MYVMWRVSLSDARVSVVVASTMSLGVLLLTTMALRSQDRATPASSVSVKIKLTIIDEATGQTIPARVEVLNDHGQSFVADDALLVGGDCSFPQEPWQGTSQEWQTRLVSQVLDPQSNNKHFYSDGTSTLSLPRGHYRWRVLKGNEYRIAAGAFDVGDGASSDQTIKLMRWCDMAGQGWYSSESHLHIARPTADVNPSISQWMQAEDLHVVNLLQNGNSRMFFACPQYAHGKDGLFRQGDFIVAAGQENPRTPLLGHALILNAREPINFPDQYLNYTLFWEEAERQGALAGRCHFGQARIDGQRTPVGLAIDLPDNLLHCVEVIQQDTGYYDFWYDAMNLGARLTPIAGTDYPCMRALPGRERFYVHVDGDFSYAAWADGIRKGRTFATNGPVIEFTVEGNQVGDEITFDRPRSLKIEARVRFDPSRDDVQSLEIIENGELLQRFTREDGKAEIHGSVAYHASQTVWLAARSTGTKLGELPHPRFKQIAPSVAHTAPIFVSVLGSPSLRDRTRAKLIAGRWIEELDGLARRLAPDRIASLAGTPQQADSVLLPVLERDRSDLLKRIDKARQWYQRILE